VLDDPVHHPDVLCKTAPRWLESGRAADLFVGQALGESLVPAVKAFATWDVMKDYNPVARGKVAHAFANRCDDSGSFVAEDAGRRVRPSSDLLEVGAANAASVNADEQLAGADLWNRNCLQAHIIHAAVDRRLHGGRNFLNLLFHRKLPGRCHKFLDELSTVSASIA
jgi:hypothetical protein